MHEWEKKWVDSNWRNRKGRWRPKISLVEVVKNDMSIKGNNIDYEFGYNRMAQKNIHGPNLTNMLRIHSQP